MKELVESVTTDREDQVRRSTTTNMGSEKRGHRGVLHGDGLIASSLGLSEAEEHTAIGRPETRVIGDRHVLDLE